jgi:hypothetical protein
MEVNLSAEGDRFRLEAQGVALELMPDPLRLRLRLDNEVVLESSTDRGVQGDLLIDPVTQADGLSVRESRSPREVGMDKLQKVIREQGVRIE